MTQAEAVQVVQLFAGFLVGSLSAFLIGYAIIKNI